MRSPLKKHSKTAATCAAALALAIAFGGCGSSTSNAKKGSGTIPLASSAIEGNELPARYTCDGQNVSPPLKWGAVPLISAEVVLIAIGKPLTGKGTPTIEWAMAGVKPELHELHAGQVPKGAFLEEASNGKRAYSICPPKGQSREYAFLIYSLPEKVIVTKNINGAALYHNLAEGPPKFRSPAAGEINAIYKRK
jgi:phosphatidylethanolamine-binding protein (PEBP) family uncharacterized protein